MEELLLDMTPPPSVIVHPYDTRLDLAVSAADPRVYLLAPKFGLKSLRYRFRLELQPTSVAS